jgi:hypothetical protein
MSEESLFAQGLPFTHFAFFPPVFCVSHPPGCGVAVRWVSAYQDFKRVSIA